MLSRLFFKRPCGIGLRFRVWPGFISWGARGSTGRLKPDKKFVLCRSGATYVLSDDRVLLAQDSAPPRLIVSPPWRHSRLSGVSRAERG